MREVDDGIGDIQAQITDKQVRIARPNMIVVFIVVAAPLVVVARLFQRYLFLLSAPREIVFYLHCPPVKVSGKATCAADKSKGR